MPYQQLLAPIIRKENLAANIFRYIIASRTIAESATPGQFLHILPRGFSLRRPISISEIDVTAGTISIIFEVKGAGTETLSNYAVGETLDILGPLGNGFTLQEDSADGKKVILVGGGIGNPPLLSLAQFYRERAIVIDGFRTANLVILQDDFSKTGAEVITCTDDGTYGRRALVTGPLAEILPAGNISQIYACGPKNMLKFVAEAARGASVPCEVSLEERMGCGIGACLVCAVPLKRDGGDVTAHVCKDGPVFNAEEVIWECRN